MPKLTPAERAILIGQFKIIQAIYKDPNLQTNAIEALSSGYELEYAEYVDGLDEPLSEESCKFVQDILFYII
jgi:uncharacterized protein YfbU (UPF0304 family)